MHASLFRHLRIATLATLMGAGVGAYAGPIAPGTFMQFAFGEVGSLATGCDPADPAGPFCVPSFGTPTLPLDAPPWTFLAPLAGAFLTITDVFESGDIFEIFDFGVSLGLTSASIAGSDCGDDPVPCLADPTMSHAVFLLLAGQHSITIRTAAAPSGSGTGYLLVQQAPEPSSLLLLGIAMLAAATGARKRPATLTRSQSQLNR
jgi:PEP-CTERM motif